MSGLLIPEWIRLPESDRHGRVIRDAVAEGLWPFRPKMVFMTLEYDIDRNEYVILVDLRFNSNPYDSQILVRARINAFHLADDPDGSMYRAGREIFTKLRFGPAFPINNPYIQLGDN